MFMVPGHQIRIRIRRIVRPFLDLDAYARNKSWTEHGGFGQYHAYDHDLGVNISTDCHGPPRLFFFFLVFASFHLSKVIYLLSF